MSNDFRAITGLTQLPAGLIDRLTRPFNHFLKIEAAGGSVLFLFTLAALILSNSPWSHQFMAFWEIPIRVQVGSLDFDHTIKELINDALMTLFFFLVALELKRELVLGELNNPRMAVLSIAAAVGGMAVPAVCYLAMQYDQPGHSGWGTVMSTDTAFVIGCLALLGSRIPKSLRVFVLSLAIIDDIGAILVMTIGYSSHIDWYALALAAFGMAVVRGMALIGIRNIAIYVMAGGLVWVAVDTSGINATITGVILGLMTPTRRWVSDERLHAILDRVVAYPAGDHWSGDSEDRKALLLAETAARETLSPVERLEIRLHPWVGFVIVPLFAFANAGIPLTFIDMSHPVLGAIFIGFVLGKPAGILLFSWLAVRTGIAIRPPGLSWGLLAGSGFLAGIGFTMALFIANLAFGPELINAAKAGILMASIASATVGIAILLWLSPRGTCHTDKFQ
jgi:NhaA family Na+:H+ antiporter